MKITGVPAAVKSVPETGFGAMWQLTVAGREKADIVMCCERCPISWRGTNLA